MAPKRIAHFRFYEELNDFLPVEIRKKTFDYNFKINQTVKDAIEAMGVPHTEVDLILVNGKSVDFSYQIIHHDRISVYPVFESFDISEVNRLRPDPLREPRFVLDVHLGKLCKYLRMMGFDTIYRNDLDDVEIVEISVKENRIILTRDIGILKNGLVTHGYWLRSQDSREQLKEVIRRFQLKAEVRPFYRCTVCNGFIRPVNKADIVTLLPDQTKKYFDAFFRCTSCKKIYWEGTHYESMRDFIGEIMKG